jgi:hypothetical protein
MANILRFRPNVPIEVSLAFPTGRRKQLGRPLLFTLTDGRVMFLPVTVADLIEHRHIQPRQSFFICRFKAGRGSLDQWRIWLPGETQPALPTEDAIRAHRIECQIEDLLLTRAIILEREREAPGAFGRILHALDGRLQFLGYREQPTLDRLAVDAQLKRIEQACILDSIQELDDAW